MKVQFTSFPFRRNTFSSIFKNRHGKLGCTGWLRETVNCNLSLMDLKSAKNGLLQWFSSRKFREVLIFWCLKRARWKKLPSFMVVPTWCVFQPDMVTVSLQSFWALWPSQSGKHTTLAQPWNTGFFSPGHFETSKYQNLPKFPWRKSLD